MAALKKSNSRLDIFTTNYDLVIESALQSVGLESMLSSSNDVASSEIDLSRWEDQLVDKEGAGLLTKLHGSVNWHRSPLGKIHVSFPELVSGSYREQLQGRGVIYPGFKGRPETYPFDLFHDYLEGAIGDAQVIIVIGFAFRDEHINQIFSQRAKDCRMININFEKVDFLASLDSSVNKTELEKGFGKEAIAEALKIAGLNK